VADDTFLEDPAIEAIELTHYYNAHPAVDKLSFQLKPGQVLGLLGPNGAGKSTTIKMLTTLLPPTSGTARILGYDIVQEPQQIRRNIGYVPQLISADGDLTANENLLLSAKLHNLPKDVRKIRIQEVLEFMGLTEFADQLVDQYSGGMIRRLEIALALIHRPRVLFLDEPTVGLDPGARKALWYRIQDLRKQFKTTILLTTHDMDEADLLCDIVAFMFQGKILVMDTPSNLKVALGPQATLDDVFIHHTGSSIMQGGDYYNAKQTRHTISHLD
jgi:ABC-2 type transport system ATP-binding protein